MTSLFISNDKMIQYSTHSAGTAERNLEWGSMRSEKDVTKGSEQIGLRKF